MIGRRRFLLGGLAFGLGFVLVPRPANAQYLGSYVARISPNDQHASDGYPLDTAAQIVRQDRANYHRFGWRDPEDQGDPWFASSDARARLQTMAERSGAMDQATRRAIYHANPLIQVDVYRSSVAVHLLGL